MGCQIWDDDPGNPISSVGSEHEARAFVRGMLGANGAGGVRNPVISACPAGGADPSTVLESVDVLASREVGV
jgi:hypothetical protein